MSLSARQLYKVIEVTWPSAKQVFAGPWALRDGAGGGKRVSAATLHGNIEEDIDIPAAEEAMRIMGQTPLFMIREQDAALDQALERRGYAKIDPVNIYLCPVSKLTDLPLPRVTAFTIWEPLAKMLEMWTEAGIGKARQAVMSRAIGPKTGILGRIDDKSAGVAFCAVDDLQDVAMVHALEIVPQHRKKGLGAWMMRAAAHWAAEWGVEWLSVICTQDNVGANRLYASLGMTLVGQYHYRILAIESDA